MFCVPLESQLSTTSYSPSLLEICIVFTILPLLFCLSFVQIFLGRLLTVFLYVHLVFNISCECQNFQVFHPHYVSQNNCLFLILFLIVLFASIFFKSFFCLQAPSTVFSASFRRTTSLSLHALSSSVRILCSIPYHIRGLMLHSSSPFFSLFLTDIFQSLDTLFSFWKVSLLYQCAFVFQCHVFRPLLSVSQIFKRPCSFDSGISNS